jgi:peroxiredoxin
MPPEASAPTGAPDPIPGAVPDAPPRKPRKRFILIGTGIGLAAVLCVGLFTNLGSPSSSSPGGGSAPGVGDPVPSFTAANIGPTGAATVVVPTDGTPTVLLFFGNWCPACHDELPPLAAAVRAQEKAGGALSHVRVIGVDSEDRSSVARSFIHASGVSFPVAYDPDLTITEGDFGLVGDPNAVFVNGNGKIAQVVQGDALTPASFTADEQALVSSTESST